MRKILHALAVFLCLCGFTAHSQTLVHYWHFNSFTGVGAATNPANLTPYRADYSLLDTSLAKVAYRVLPGTSSAYTTYWDGASTGDTTNARQNAVAGNYLRLRNPADSMSLLIYAPSNGFKDPVFRYTVQKSSAGNGAAVNYFSYSVDSGATWITTGMSIDSFVTSASWTTTPVTISINNAAAANNARLVFRIRFGTTGATGTSGNNRLDNISMEGTSIPQQALLHYWHFNNFTGVGAATNPANLTPYRADYSLLDTSLAKVAYRVLPGTSSAYITYWDGASTGDTTNARQNAVAGNYLRLRNPADSMALLIYAPTTGYYQPVIKYTVQKSSAGNGAAVNYFSYSVDSGATWVTTGLSKDSFVTSAAWTTSPVEIKINNPAADNNARLVFRIRFGTAGATGTSGNNRIDNISVDGSTAPAPGNNVDVTAPVVSFNPANNSTDISIQVQPTITFNEPVRLLNNDVIDNSNVAGLIELRLNDETGTPAAFTASINGKVITVTPVSSLNSSQVYYLAVKANMIEDSADNAITSVQSVKFTTLAPQTIFAAGDIVPVAYRMNASNADDEVALLTLVDILPGTRINLTDAKYTTNSPAQCADGMVWTAPASGVAAGSVISIKNDVPSLNIGSLSGNKFGLSSGGDQFIVYTGTNVNPAYIMALSSNAWLTTNTSCSGSNSMLPAGLTDGTSSIQLSAASGNVSGNTANAFYTGTQAGTPAQLRAAILDPANWTGVASGTPAQTWPVWSFPGPPSVISVSVINATTLRVIFNEDLDAVSATNPANFTGIANLSNIARSSNGALADTLILTYSVAFAGGSSNTLTINGVKDAGNVSMFAPHVFSFTYNTSLSFAAAFASVKEDSASVNVVLNLSNPSVSSVRLVVKPAPFSTASSADVVLTSYTMNFTGASSSVQQINIPVINDAIAEQDEYLVLSLENASGLALGANSTFTLFIRDNDKKAPVAQKNVELKYVGSFDPSPVSGSTTEIVVYDSASKRLIMTSAIQDRFDIADFTRPDSIVLVKSINMAAYGGVTSVAVKNGLIAVASPNANEQLNGSVVFFNINGDSLKRVTVGALPDMITFSPDGKKVLTANEGQPSLDYTVDPEGSVSVIDLSGGINTLAQANATTILFTAFNAQETALRAQGVRKLKSSSTLSQDFEPEYLTVSADGTKAWVTLQENNAIGEIDLQTNTITAVWPLGMKDYNAMGNGFDASDNSGFIHLSNYPVRAFYIPDAISSYQVSGTTYLVTANEGDEKEYTGLNERTTVGAVTLDSAKFPNGNVLKANHHIGRLRITNLSGDTDSDGDNDELHVVGSRSFTIWNAATHAQVYDSGDDFERITSTDPSIAAQFNADNEGNGMKSRSRAKGPEPEGLTVANIDGKPFAFVALERVGGVMVYDITNPAAPVYQDYKNSRSLTSYAGDHGPEGITYISPSQSPDGKAYITVANELSGTISVYEVKNNMPKRVEFARQTRLVSEGASAVQIPIILDYPAAEQGKVTLKVFNGSGINASDYQLSPAITYDTFVVNISKGATTADFTFTPQEDNEDEGNETITFQVIRSTAGLNIGTKNTMVITIMDNDTTIPVRILNFDASSQVVNEKSGTITVNMNLSAPSDGTGRVVLKVLKGAGVTAADYATNPTSTDSIVLDITNGASSVSFGLTVADDTEDERDEMLAFSILRVEGNIMPGSIPSFELAILDDDTLNNSVNELLINGRILVMYPNPNNAGEVYFSEAIDAELFDLQGKLLKAETNTRSLTTREFAKGIYYVRINGMITQKLIIE